MELRKIPFCITRVRAEIRNRYNPNRDKSTSHWIGITYFKYKHDKKTQESDLCAVVYTGEFSDYLSTGNLLKDSAPWSMQELHTGGNKHEQ
jgi:hypothetical protein